MSGASPAAGEVEAPEPAPADDPLRAPPLPRRLAAFLYEGVLCFGILFATGLVYAVTVHQTHALQHRSGLVGSCFVVLGLYFVGLWVRSGQTLAMKTWHLRVVTTDGRPLAPRRALLRYLLAWVWVLPPLMLAKALALPSAGADFGLLAAWIVLYAASARLHPRRQFWHDAVCGTAIVTARPVAPLPA